MPGDTPFAQLPDEITLTRDEDVLVLGQVVDVGALTAGAHEAGEAQLGEMLGHRCGLRADVVSQAVHGVLPVEQRPHDP